MSARLEQKHERGWKISKNAEAVFTQASPVIKVRVKLRALHLYKLSRRKVGDKLPETARNAEILIGGYILFSLYSSNAAEKLQNLSQIVKKTPDFHLIQGIK